MLGCADVRSQELQRKILEKVAGVDYESTILRFRTAWFRNLVNGYWDIVSSALNEFKNSETDMSAIELRDLIMERFNGYSVMDNLDDEYKSAVTDVLWTIRSDVNDIINIYAPGAEISETAVSSVKNTFGDFSDEFNDGVNEFMDNVASQLSGLFTSMISNILFTVLFYLNPPLAAILWAGGKVVDLFSDKDDNINEKLSEPISKIKRAGVCLYIKSFKEGDIKLEISKSVKEAFSKYEDDFLRTFVLSLKKHADNFVTQNIINVKIPIE